MATAKKASAAKATRGRAQDRKLVAAKQTYEVTYVSKETKKTPAEVKAAIEKAGHSRVKIMKLLKGKA